jgi:hypothetical protein
MFLQRRFVRVSLGAFAALVFVLLCGRNSAADTLTIDSSVSSLTFGFSLVSLEDGTVIGTFVGQGDIPQGSLPTGNGNRFPGFSNGLSAQATGTIDVTPGAFSIDGGLNVGLLNSGSWQPGTPFGAGFLAAPIPAQIGGYLETALLGGASPDTFVSARINSGLLDMVSSGPLTLGPGGTFDDPLGTASLVTGLLAFSAINPLTAGGVLNASESLPFTSGVFDLSGTFLNGQLSMLISGSLTVDATDLFLGLPIGIKITADGNIVTTPVPEPTSIVLLIIGAASTLLFAAVRIVRQRPTASAL